MTTLLIPFNSARLSAAPELSRAALRKSVQKSNRCYRPICGAQRMTSVPVYARAEGLRKTGLLLMNAGRLRVRNFWS
ncbi:hypothetical protein DYI42_03630 [Vannielia litorea]|nr:hypothetical protein [Vannielia litorea]